MSDQESILSIIAGRAEALWPEVQRLRRDFHRHPELSNQEGRTGQVVARYLEELGLEVTTGLAGHGVMGILQGSSPGRTVAYRADMDALPITEAVDCPWRSGVPGVMHACGHDFHLSIALVAARLLAERREQLSGQIRFIFQPAEEGLPPGEEGGAGAMVEAGVLDKPRVEAMVALHIAPRLDVGKIGYFADVVMAGADQVHLEIRGEQVHAATPHQGVDAIMVAAQALNQLQSVLVQGKDSRQPVVLSFGKIAGGNRFNILADRVILEGTLRYHDPGVRKALLDRIERLLGGLTQGYGADYRLDSQPINPVLANDAELTGQALAILRRLFGPAHLKLLRPVMGSEDFAHYAARVPGFYFFLGTRTPGTKGSALHTPTLDPDEQALAVGVKATAGLLFGLSQAELEKRRC
jgi:amidohydrolase